MSNATASYFYCILYIIEQMTTELVGRNRANIQMQTAQQSLTDFFKKPYVFRFSISFLIVKILHCVFFIAVMYVCFCEKTLHQQKTFIYNQNQWKQLFENISQ
eukprot:164514_1